MDEIGKKLKELEVAIKANAEQSNSRMQNVNQMITNILEVMAKSANQQRIIEDALKREQEASIELIKNNGELIRECRELRTRCEDLSHEIRHLLESIGVIKGITIENKQM